MTGTSVYMTTVVPPLEGRVTATCSQLPCISPHACAAAADPTAALLARIDQFTGAGSTSAASILL